MFFLFVCPTLSPIIIMLLALLPLVVGLTISRWSIIVDIKLGGYGVKSKP
jgi:hypothetical protein